MALRIHGSIPASRVRALDAYVRDQQITEQVFRGIDAQDLSLDAVVHMDEYTIDLVTGRTVLGHAACVDRSPWTQPGEE